MIKVISKPVALLLAFLAVALIIIGFLVHGADGTDSGADPLGLRKTPIYASNTEILALSGYNIVHDTETVPIFERRPPLNARNLVATVTKSLTRAKVRTSAFKTLYEAVADMKDSRNMVTEMDVDGTRGGEPTNTKTSLKGNFKSALSKSQSVREMKKQKGSQDRRFLRVTVDVHTLTTILNAGNMVLDPGFLYDLQRLPLLNVNSTKTPLERVADTGTQGGLMAEYFLFFAKYGTHYRRKSRYGGHLEFVYSAVKSEKMTETQFEKASKACESTIMALDVNNDQSKEDQSQDPSSNREVVQVFNAPSGNSQIGEFVEISEDDRAMETLAAIVSTELSQEQDEGAQEGGNVWDTENLKKDPMNIRSSNLESYCLLPAARAQALDGTDMMSLFLKKSAEEGMARRRRGGKGPYVSNNEYENLKVQEANERQIGAIMTTNAEIGKAAKEYVAGESDEEDDSDSAVVVKNRPSTSAVDVKMSGKMDFQECMNQFERNKNMDAQLNSKDAFNVYCKGGVSCQSLLFISSPSSLRAEVSKWSASTWNYPAYLDSPSSDYIPISDVFDDSIHFKPSTKNGNVSKVLGRELDRIVRKRSLEMALESYLAFNGEELDGSTFCSHIQCSVPPQLLASGDCACADYECRFDLLTRIAEAGDSVESQPLDANGDPLVYRCAGDTYWDSELNRCMPLSTKYRSCISPKVSVNTNFVNVKTTECVKQCPENMVPQKWIKWYMCPAQPYSSLNGPKDMMPFYSSAVMLAKGAVNVIKERANGMKKPTLSKMCSEDVQFCVPLCGGNTYIYSIGKSRRCVKKCPPGYFADDTLKICKQKCKIEEFIKYDQVSGNTKCVKSCGTDIALPTPSTRLCVTSTPLGFYNITVYTSSFPAVSCAKGGVHSKKVGNFFMDGSGIAKAKDDVPPTTMLVTSTKVEDLQKAWDIMNEDYENQIKTFAANQVKPKIKITKHKKKFLFWTTASWDTREVIPPSPAQKAAAADSAWEEKQFELQNTFASVYDFLRYRGCSQTGVRFPTGSFVKSSPKFGSRCRILMFFDARNLNVLTFANNGKTLRYASNGERPFAFMVAGGAGSIGANCDSFLGDNAKCIPFTSMRDFADNNTVVGNLFPPLTFDANSETVRLKNAAVWSPTQTYFAFTPIDRVNRMAASSCTAPAFLSENKPKVKVWLPKFAPPELSRYTKPDGFGYISSGIPIGMLKVLFSERAITTPYVYKSSTLKVNSRIFGQMDRPSNTLHPSAFDQHFFEYQSYAADIEQMHESGDRTYARYISVDPQRMKTAFILSDPSVDCFIACVEIFDCSLFCSYNLDDGAILADFDSVTPLNSAENLIGIYDFSEVPVKGLLSLLNRERIRRGNTATYTQKHFIKSHYESTSVLSSVCNGERVTYPCIKALYSQMEHVVDSEEAADFFETYMRTNNFAFYVPFIGGSSRFVAVGKEALNYEAMLHQLKARVEEIGLYAEKRTRMKARSLAKEIDKVYPTLVHEPKSEVLLHKSLVQFRQLLNSYYMLDDKPFAAQLKAGDTVLLHVCLHNSVLARFDRRGGVFEELLLRRWTRQDPFSSPSPHTPSPPSGQDNLLKSMVNETLLAKVVNGYLGMNSSNSLKSTLAVQNRLQSPDTFMFVKNISDIQKDTEQSGSETKFIKNHLEQKRVQSLNCHEFQTDNVFCLLGAEPANMITVTFSVNHQTQAGKLISQRFVQVCARRGECRSNRFLIPLTKGIGYVMFTMEPRNRILRFDLLGKREKGLTEYTRTTWLTYIAHAYAPHSCFEDDGCFTEDRSDAFTLFRKAMEKTNAFAGTSNVLFLRSRPSSKDTIFPEIAKVFLSGIEIKENNVEYFNANPLAAFMQPCTYRMVADPTLSRRMILATFVEFQYANKVESQMVMFVYVCYRVCERRTLSIGTAVGSATDSSTFRVPHDGEDMRSQIEATLSGHRIDEASLSWEMASGLPDDGYQLSRYSQTVANMEHLLRNITAYEMLIENVKNRIGENQKVTLVGFETVTQIIGKRLHSTFLNIELNNVTSSMVDENEGEVFKVSKSPGDVFGRYVSELKAYYWILLESTKILSHSSHVICNEQKKKAPLHFLHLLNELLHDEFDRKWQNEVKAGYSEIAMRNLTSSAISWKRLDRFYTHFSNPSVAIYPFIIISFGQFSIQINRTISTEQTHCLTKTYQSCALGNSDIALFTRYKMDPENGNVFFQLMAPCLSQRVPENACASVIIEQSKITNENSGVLLFERGPYSVLFSAFPHSDPKNKDIENRKSSLPGNRMHIGTVYTLLEYSLEKMGDLSNLVSSLSCGANFDILQPLPISKCSCVYPFLLDGCRCSKQLHQFEEEDGLCSCDQANNFAPDENNPKNCVCDRSKGLTASTQNADICVCEYGNNKILNPVTNMCECDTRAGFHEDPETHSCVFATLLVLEIRSVRKVQCPRGLGFDFASLQCVDGLDNLGSDGTADDPTPASKGGEPLSWQTMKDAGSFNNKERAPRIGSKSILYDDMREEGLKGMNIGTVSTSSVDPKLLNDLKVYSKDVAIPIVEVKFIGKVAIEVVYSVPVSIYANGVLENAVVSRLGLNTITEIEIRNQTKLDTIPPWFFSGLRNLRRLSIESCGLTSLSLDSSLSGLPSLSFLSLRQNQLKHIGFGAFDRVPLLSTLDIRENRINYVDSRVFCFLENLRRFKVDLIVNVCLPPFLFNSPLFVIETDTNLYVPSRDLNGKYRCTSESICRKSGDGKCSLSNGKPANSLICIPKTSALWMNASTSLTELILKKTSLDWNETPLVVRGIPFLSFFRSEARKSLEITFGTRDIDVVEFDTVIVKNARIQTITSTLMKGMFFVRKLVLYDCGISNIETDAFKEMTSLTELTISGNNITELSGGSFSSMQSLEVLRLSGNGIIVAERKSLNTPSLRELYLDCNELETLPPTIFDSLVQLRVLHLNSNRIRSFPKEVLGNLISLQELDISDNLYALLYETFDNMRAPLTSVRLSIMSVVCMPYHIYSFTLVMPSSVPVYCKDVTGSTVSKYRCEPHTLGCPVFPRETGVGVDQTNQLDMPSRLCSSDRDCNVKSFNFDYSFCSAVHECVCGEFSAGGKCHIPTGHVIAEVNGNTHEYYRIPLYPGSLIKYIPKQAYNVEISTPYMTSSLFNSGIFDGLSQIARIVINTIVPLPEPIELAHTILQTHPKLYSMSNIVIVEPPLNIRDIRRYAFDAHWKGKHAQLETGSRKRRNVDRNWAKGVCKELALSLEKPVVESMRQLPPASAGIIRKAVANFRDRFNADVELCNLPDGHTEESLSEYSPLVLQRKILTDTYVYLNKKLKLGALYFVPSVNSRESEKAFKILVIVSLLKSTDANYIQHAHRHAFEFLSAIVPCQSLEELNIIVDPVSKYWPDNPLICGVNTIVKAPRLNGIAPIHYSAFLYAKQHLPSECDFGTVVMSNVDLDKSQTASVMTRQASIVSLFSSKYFGFNNLGDLLHDITINTWLGTDLKTMSLLLSSCNLMKAFENDISGLYLNQFLPVITSFELRAYTQEDVQNGDLTGASVAFDSFVCSIGDIDLRFLLHLKTLKMLFVSQNEFFVLLPEKYVEQDDSTFHPGSSSLPASCTLVLLRDALKNPIVPKSSYLLSFRTIMQEDIKASTKRQIAVECVGSDDPKCENCLTQPAQNEQCFSSLCPSVNKFNECSGHGRCFDGLCICYLNWEGSNCALPKAQSYSGFKRTSGDAYSLLQCSGLGPYSLQQGKCLCSLPDIGELCNECGDGGSCDNGGFCESRKCVCPRGYGGSVCQYVFVEACIVSFNPVKNRKENFTSTLLLKPFMFIEPQPRYAKIPPSQSIEKVSLSRVLSPFAEENRRLSSIPPYTFYGLTSLRELDIRNLVFQNVGAQEGKSNGLIIPGRALETISSLRALNAPRDSFLCLSELEQFNFKNLNVWVKDCKSHRECCSAKDVFQLPLAINILEATRGTRSLDLSRVSLQCSALNVYKARRSDFGALESSYQKDLSLDVLSQWSRAYVSCSGSTLRLIKGPTDVKVKARHSRGDQQSFTYKGSRVETKQAFEHGVFDILVNLPCKSPGSLVGAWLGQASALESVYTYPCTSRLRFFEVRYTSDGSIEIHSFLNYPSTSECINSDPEGEANGPQLEYRDVVRRADRNNIPDKVPISVFGKDFVYDCQARKSPWTRKQFSDMARSVCSNRGMMMFDVKIRLVWTEKAVSIQYSLPELASAGVKSVLFTDQVHSIPFMSHHLVFLHEEYKLHSESHTDDGTLSGKSPDISNVQIKSVQYSPSCRHSELTILTIFPSRNSLQQGGCTYLALKNHVNSEFPQARLKIGLNIANLVEKKSPFCTLVLLPRGISSKTLDTFLYERIDDSCLKENNWKDSLVKGLLRLGILKVRTSFPAPVCRDCTSKLYYRVLEDNIVSDVDIESFLNPDKHSIGSLYSSGAEQSFFSWVTPSRIVDSSPVFVEQSGEDLSLLFQMGSQGTLMLSRTLHPNPIILVSFTLQIETEVMNEFDDRKVLLVAGEIQNFAKMNNDFKSTSYTGQLKSLSVLVYQSCYKKVCRYPLVLRVTDGLYVENHDAGAISAEYLVNGGFTCFLQICFTPEKKFSIHTRPLYSKSVDVEAVVSFNEVLPLPESESVGSSNVKTDKRFSYFFVLQSKNVKNVVVSKISISTTSSDIAPSKLKCPHQVLYSVPFRENPDIKSSIGRYGCVSDTYMKCNRGYSTVAYKHYAIHMFIENGSYIRFNSGKPSWAMSGNFASISNDLMRLHYPCTAEEDGRALSLKIDLTRIRSNAKNAVYKAFSEWDDRRSPIEGLKEKGLNVVILRLVSPLACEGDAVTCPSAFDIVIAPERAPSSVAGYVYLAVRHGYIKSGSEIFKLSTLYDGQKWLAEWKQEKPGTSNESSVLLSEPSLSPVLLEDVKIEVVLYPIEFGRTPAVFGLYVNGGVRIEIYVNMKTNEDISTSVHNFFHVLQIHDFKVKASELDDSGVYAVPGDVNGVQFNEQAQVKAVTGGQRSILYSDCDPNCVILDWDWCKASSTKIRKLKLAGQGSLYNEASEKPELYVRKMSGLQADPSFNITNPVVVSYKIGYLDFFVEPGYVLVVELARNFGSLRERFKSGLAYDSMDTRQKHARESFKYFVKVEKCSNNQCQVVVGILYTKLSLDYFVNCTSEGKRYHEMQPLHTFDSVQQGSFAKILPRKANSKVQNNPNNQSDLSFDLDFEWQISYSHWPNVVLSSGEKHAMTIFTPFVPDSESENLMPDCKHENIEPTKSYTVNVICLGNCVQSKLRFEQIGQSGNPGRYDPEPIDASLATSMLNEAKWWKCQKSAFCYTPTLKKDRMRYNIPPWAIKIANGGQKLVTRGKGSLYLSSASDSERQGLKFRRPYRIYFPSFSDHACRISFAYFLVTYSDGKRYPLFYYGFPSLQKTEDYIDYLKDDKTSYSQARMVVSQRERVLWASNPPLRSTDLAIDVVVYEYDVMDRPFLVPYYYSEPNMASAHHTFQSASDVYEIYVQRGSILKDPFGDFGLLYEFSSDVCENSQSCHDDESGKMFVDLSTSPKDEENRMAYTFCENYPDYFCLSGSSREKEIGLHYQFEFNSRLPILYPTVRDEGEKTFYISIGSSPERSDVSYVLSVRISNIPSAFSSYYIGLKYVKDREFQVVEDFKEILVSPEIECMEDLKKKTLEESFDFDELAGEWTENFYISLNAFLHAFVNSRLMGDREITSKYLVLEYVRKTQSFGKILKWALNQGSDDSSSTTDIESDLKDAKETFQNTIGPLETNYDFYTNIDSLKSLLDIRDFLNFALDDQKKPSSKDIKDKASKVNSSTYILEEDYKKSGFAFADDVFDSLSYFKDYYVLSSSLSENVSERIRQESPYKLLDPNYIQSLPRGKIIVREDQPNLISIALDEHPEVKYVYQVDVDKVQREMNDVLSQLKTEMQAAKNVLFVSDVDVSMITISYGIGDQSMRVPQFVRGTNDKYFDVAMEVTVDVDVKAKVPANTFYSVSEAIQMQYDIKSHGTCVSKAAGLSLSIDLPPLVPKESAQHSMADDGDKCSERRPCYYIAALGSYCAIQSKYLRIHMEAGANTGICSSCTCPTTKTDETNEAGHCHYLSGGCKFCADGFAVQGNTCSKCETGSYKMRTSTVLANDQCVKCQCTGGGCRADNGYCSECEYVEEDNLNFQQVREHTYIDPMYPKQCKKCDCYTNSPCTFQTGICLDRSACLQRQQINFDFGGLPGERACKDCSCGQGECNLIGKNGVCVCGEGFTLGLLHKEGFKDMSECKKCENVGQCPKCHSVTGGCTVCKDNTQYLKQIAVDQQVGSLMNTIFESDVQERRVKVCTKCTCKNKLLCDELEKCTGGQCLMSTGQCFECEDKNGEMMPNLSDPNKRYWWAKQTKQGTTDELGTHHYCQSCTCSLSDKDSKKIGGQCDNDFKCKLCASKNAKEEEDLRENKDYVIDGELCKKCADLPGHCVTCKSDSGEKPECSSCSPGYTNKNSGDYFCNQKCKHYSSTDYKNCETCTADIGCTKCKRPYELSSKCTYQKVKFIFTMTVGKDKCYFGGKKPSLCSHSEKPFRIFGQEIYFDEDKYKSWETTVYRQKDDETDFMSFYVWGSAFGCDYSKEVTIDNPYRKCTDSRTVGSTVSLSLSPRDFYFKKWWWGQRYKCQYQVQCVAEKGEK
eukprot:Nk52_evm2s227 gene=Nk52_evmTU2s227